MSQSLKSGLGTRTVMTWPESASKLVGLNHVWKLCRLTLVSMRARIKSQILAAMTVCPKKSGRWPAGNSVVTFCLRLQRARADFSAPGRRRPIESGRHSALAQRSRLLAADFPQCFPQVWKTWGDKPNAHGVSHARVNPRL